MARHAGRLGGPLRDRIDVSVRVGRIDPELLLRDSAPASTIEVRDRISDALGFCREMGRVPGRRLQGQRLLSACRMGGEARSCIAEASRALRLSGRGVTRVLRVARTIADLEASVRVQRPHILEAICLRNEGSVGER
jgi:magnesium chelatase family protein